jgi:hypothetical protein
MAAAKMADGPARLPKWQPQQILCQIAKIFFGTVFAYATIMPNQNIFSLIFSICNCRYVMYHRGKEREKKP